MRNRWFVVSGFAFVCCVTLGACSGGGGSGQPVLYATPAASASAAAGPVASVATQRSVSASALSAVGNGVDFDELNGSGGLSTLALSNAYAASRKRSAAAAPVCRNGIEVSQSSTGSGDVTQRIETFYDAPCTQPYKLITRTITFGSSSGSAQGTEQDFDQSGDTVAYKTDAMTFALASKGRIANFVDQRSVAMSTSAAPFAQTGESCVNGSSSQIDCGAGNAIALSEPTASPSPISESIGFAGTVTGSLMSAASPSPTPSASGSTSSANFGAWAAPHQLALQFAGAGYTAPLDALVLAPAATPPAFTLTSGTQVLSLTGTATLGFGGYGGGGQNSGGAALSNLSVTLSDTADGLTVSLAPSGSMLAGSVANAGGTTLATIALDYSGSGTVTYSNGTTSMVRDFIIIG